MNFSIRLNSERKEERMQGPAYLYVGPINIPGAQDWPRPIRDVLRGQSKAMIAGITRSS